MNPIKDSAGFSLSALVSGTMNAAEIGLLAIETAFAAVLALIISSAALSIDEIEVRNDPNYKLQNQN